MIQVKENERSEGETESKSGLAISESESAKFKSKRVKDAYALVVGKKGMDYNRLLNIVKSKIGKSQLGKTIKSVKTTKKGELLLLTLRQNDRGFTLSKIIQDAIGNVIIRKADKKENNDALHIRGMDAIVTKEGIEQQNGSLERKLFRIG